LIIHHEQSTCTYASAPQLNNIIKSQNQGKKISLSGVDRGAIGGSFGRAFMWAVLI
jgi:hypothetical protein